MVFGRKPDMKPYETMPGDSRASFASPAPGGSLMASAGESMPGDALVESVIGSDLEIEGQSITIRCKGLLRVNGNIQADLHGKKLVVGRDASITGAITAEAVDVHGKVQGMIEADVVTLRATSDVEGDIASRNLTIEAGAAFEGRARKAVPGAQSPKAAASAGMPQTQGGHPLPFRQI